MSRDFYGEARILAVQLADVACRAHGPWGAGPASVLTP